MSSIFKARKTSRRWSYKVKLPDGRWHTFPGFTDKRATSAKAEQHQAAIDRGEVGLVDAFAESKRQLLTKHITDYATDLTAQGRDPMHVYTTTKRLQKLAMACDWARLTDITPQSFSIWRAQTTIQCLSPKTRNEYLQALQAFCRWAVRQGRIGQNPVASLMPVKTNGDVRRQRRALSDSEVTRLLAVAGERRSLYLVALTCGLRRSEVAALLWSDVKLAAPKPYLDIRPSTTKNGKRAILWLRDDVAAALRAMPDHVEGDRVFPMVGKDFCERWFYRDLAAAGITRLDAQKRRVDFHALRHTLATNLGRGGVSIRTAMEVMRHSDARLTTKTYTDASALPTAQALDCLPRYDLPLAGLALKDGTFDSTDLATKSATTSATKPCTLACAGMPGYADLPSIGHVVETPMDIGQNSDLMRIERNNRELRKTAPARART